MTTFGRILSRITGDPAVESPADAGDYELVLPAGGGLAATWKRPPAGGSSEVSRTITAAEIAAVWNVGDGAAAIELYQGPRFVTTPAIDPTWDLDNVNGVSLVAYSPGATSDDVYNNGEGLSQVYSPDPNDWTIDTYHAESSIAVSAPPATALLAGGALYLLIQGSAPPTTGSITVSLV